MRALLLDAPMSGTEQTTALPEFTLGGRPTKVVAVGSAFAAIYADDGEPCTFFINARLEDAAHHARYAAEWTAREAEGEEQGSDDVDF
jgi:hypothetical protein